MAAAEQRDRPPGPEVDLARLREEAALADLGLLVATARRRWRWLLFLSVGLALGAGLVSSLQPRRYEATATLVLGPTSATSGQLDRSNEQVDRELKTEAQLLNDQAMEQLIEGELGDYFSYSAEPVVGTELLVITAEASSAQSAATAANAVAGIYLNQRQELVRAEIDRVLKSRAASVEQLTLELQDPGSSTPDADRSAGIATQLAAARAAMEELRQEASVLEGSARVASVAVPPDEPFAPNPVRSVALAAVIGLLLGAALSWIRERSDSRLRSLGDLEDFSGRLECLGQVGRPRLFDGPGPVALAIEPLAEQFRVLASNIAQRDNKSYVIQITGIHGGEGSTYVAANLATSLALGGWNTVVVDADMTNGQLHRVFGVKPRPGLKQLLRGEQLGSIVQRSSLVDELGVVASGSQDDTSISVHGTGLAIAIDRLAAHFDVVIVDSPPILASGDASILAHHVDKTVLVAALDHSDRADVADAVVAVRSAGGSLTGLIATERMTIATTLRRTGVGVPPMGSGPAARQRGTA